jgi:acyl transferase domain-containing protein
VAVGNDGRTMGLTTPNPAAQAQVVRRALDLAGRRAQDVGMLEAHGTATMIGDPIELRALTDVYREHTDRVGFCAIGSVKSNIGHLLSAAGIAGLIKVLLALEHGAIPATLFCEIPNPRFDFAASPFFPNIRLREWPAGDRVAGVSAFGLGGTNAHLIATAAPGHQARRVRLPAPVFDRRRLWWDRGSQPQPVVPTENGNGAGGRSRLVASVLDLTFQPTAPTIAEGRR